MSSATIPIVHSAGAAPNERDRVFLRRREELLRAGYGTEAADMLAASSVVDLELAIELRARRLWAVSECV
jgi:hypothetical protein